MWSFLKQLNNRDQAVDRAEFNRHFQYFVKANLKRMRRYNLQAVFNLCLAQFRRTLQGVLI